MYAIVQVGGRQYRAAPGERLVVDRLDVEAGSRVHLADVRMLIAEDGDATETEIGRPRLDDVAVAARAISHFRGPKILVFKYKPKKRYRRHQGFRAELTELRIEEVRRGVYEDKPAAEPAKKRTPARGALPVAEKGASAAEQATAPAEAANRPKGGMAAAAKARAAAAPAESKVTPDEAVKPKATRVARKPAEKAAGAPAEKKAPQTRAKKATEKQEQPDGS